MTLEGLWVLDSRSPHSVSQGVSPGPEGDSHLRCVPLPYGITSVTSSTNSRAGCLESY